VDPAAHNNVVDNDGRDDDDSGRTRHLGLPRQPIGSIDVVPLKYSESFDLQGVSLSGYY